MLVPRASEAFVGLGKFQCPPPQGDALDIDKFR